jgi:hypothetical protein
VKMAAQLYCDSHCNSITSVVYKEVPVQRGKWKTPYISLTMTRCSSVLFVSCIFLVTGL